MFGMEFGSFSYDGTSDPVEFLKKFNLQAKAANWKAEDKAEAIQYYLKGKAERIFNGIASDKRTFDEIAKALIAGCSQPQEVLLYAFYQRKPQPGEQLSTFALALQDLLNKAVPTLDDRHKAIFLRAQLAQHLPDHMRALIQFNANKTWDELLSAMDQAMPFVQAHGGSSNVFNYGSGGLANIKTEAVDVNATSANRGGNRSGKFNGECHYCKKKGHKVSECWKKQQEMARQGNKNSQSTINRRGHDHGGKSRSNRTGNNVKVNAMSLDGDDSDNSLVEANSISVGALNCVELKESGNVASSLSSTIASKQVLEEGSSEQGSSSDGKNGYNCSSNEPILDLLALSTSVPLMCRDIKLHLMDSEKVKLRALFDGGATNSFIKASGLPKAFRAKLDKAKETGCCDSNIKLLPICIRGATGVVQETCVLVNLKVSIGRWTGNHEFIVTDSIVDKQVILGRDFLKKNGVIINHGSDSISINSSSNGRPNFGLEEESCALVNSVVIEPHSERIVECRFKSVEIAKEFLFEPKQIRDGVYGAHALCTSDSTGKFRVCVINTTSDSVKLDANLKIGTASTSYSLVPNSESVECKLVDTAANKVAKEVFKTKLDSIKIGDGLTKEQQSRLRALLEAKRQAFQLSEDDTGRTHLIEHKIDTAGHAPIKQKQFKLPQALQSEVTKQIDGMLKASMIEESSSPWCSPMMIIRQVTREGTVKYRFVIDFRKLNETTIKDSFPLHRMDQVIEALNGAIYFSVMDMARGYLQVPLAEADREKTAFIANNKLYHFKVMPLGLCNAPSTYSRLMDLVLNGLTYKYCLVYLDDTIVYSKSFDEHLKHVEEILDRIIAAGLKLRPEKCHFAADTVSYLGFTVSRNGVSPDGNKVKALSERQFPKTRKELVNFLGAVNFYRDFIPRFSFVASCLYKICQSNAKFKAKMNSPDVIAAFDRLKQALVSTPVLAFPDFEKPFTIQTDASSVALGAVIGQIKNGKFHPCMYSSRHLSDAETRYSATERELLAIVWAAKRFNAYIYGRNVTFITDHKPLVTMKSLKEPNGRIGRLLNKIQDVDYKLIYHETFTFW